MTIGQRFSHATEFPLPLIERGGGTHWTVQATGDGNGQVKAVSCPSASSCTAVGFPDDSGTPGAYVATWDGTSWSLDTLPTPKPSDVLGSLAVSCPSESSCMAAGGSFVGRAGGNLRAFADVLGA